MGKKLTLRETCETLRISRNTAMRWCRTGKLPATKLGRRWLIDAEALDKMLEVKSDE